MGRVAAAPRPIPLCSPCPCAAAGQKKIDQDLPLFEVRTLTTALRSQRWFLNVFGTLFSCLPLTGLLMASVGIYAVVAQRLRRTREDRDCMALGATARLSPGGPHRGLAQLLSVWCSGWVDAFASTRLLEQHRLLVGKSPPIAVFTGITLLLIAIGVVPAAAGPKAERICGRPKHCARNRLTQD